MKKRLLLTVLPACLVLAGCNPLSDYAAAGTKVDLFAEDTLAHEEVFDKGFERQPMKSIGDVENPDTDSDPAIGIQSIVEDGKVSFRFVAAVAFGSGELNPTKAVWTRTISKPNGDAYENATTSFDTGTYECEKAYTSLSSDGEPYTIQQYNAEKGTSYTHFVVYTVRNIPLNAGYNDYYVSAYLTLSDKDAEDGKEGLNQATKAIVVSVDRSEKYTYVPNLGEYTLFGTVGGNPYLKKADVVRSNVGDTDIAKFNDVVFSDGDSFLIREFYNTKVYIKKPYLAGEGNAVGYWFDGSGSSIETIYDGKYNLSLNKDNQLWVGSASNVVSNGELYIDVNVGWWGDASAWTSVYAYDGTLATGHGKWFALTGTFWGNSFRTHTADPFFTAQTYAAGYTNVVVCRLKNGTNLPDDKTVWDTSIIHNQYDLSLKTNGLEDCVYLYNNVEYSMGKR